MKNTYKTNAAPIIASLLALAVLAIPAFAASGPGSTPPGGNVDASFNSVTAGSGGTSLGGSFTGKDYGVIGQGRDIAGGHFESLTTPTHFVDLGLADAAMKANGLIDVNGMIRAGGGSVETGGKFTGTKYGIFSSAVGATGSAGYFESIYSGGKPYNSVLLGTPSSSAIYTQGSIQVKNGSIYNDGLYIANDGTIASSLSDTVAKSTPVKFNSSIVVDGKIKAASGIGRFYIKEGAAATVAAGGYTSVYAGCDAFTHRRISCGFTSSGSEVVQSDTGISGAEFSCSIYVKNLSASASSNVTANALCFDSNG